MTSALSPNDVRELLEELASRLDRARISAGVRIVGGAAISLLDEGRRSTTDVDAIILPAGAASEIVTELAKERGLPEDWLNSAALAYIPAVGPADWVEVIKLGDVSISIASVQMLLAMKLFANRGIRDSDDIEFLLAACGVTSVDDAQAIYERYQAQDVLSPGAVARVQHWLDTQ